MTLSSEFGDMQINGLEMTHLDGFDVIVNYNQKEIGVDVLNKLKQEVRLMIDGGKLKPGEFGDWPRRKFQSGKSFHFVNDEQSPIFFAKQKWANKSDGLFAFQIARLRAKDDCGDIEKSMYQAGNSVLSEMRIYEDVKGVLSSIEVSELVKGFGIDTVRVVDPLVAVINRKVEKKYLVFPYVKGSIVESGDLPVDFVKKLSDIFKLHGIKAGDLAMTQLLIDKAKNTLYVLDIEFFVKIPKNDANGI